MYDPNMQTDVQYIRDNQKINLLLPDEESLDQIGYKVLQNTSGASLLCGYKSGYNGRVKITYEISKYTSLDGLLTQLSFEELEAGGHFHRLQPVKGAAAVFSGQGAGQAGEQGGV